MAITKGTTNSACCSHVIDEIELPAVCDFRCDNKAATGSGDKTCPADHIVLKVDERRFARMCQSSRTNCFKEDTNPSKLASSGSREFWSGVG
jgi:hypothetical protein